MDRIGCGVPTKNLSKKTGRPAGNESLVAIRLPLELSKAIDVWAKRYGHTKSSAIRLFIEIALKRKG